MTTLAALHMRTAKIDILLGRDRPMPLVAADPEARRRSRIWDISPSLHCSVIGTCLSAGQLRQLFAKLGETDARTATDHVLHSRGVRLAGQQTQAAKLLNKTLDKLHDSAVRRFAKARSAEDLKTLWMQALDQGDIPGAYWAILTHPIADRGLVQDVFGDIHMLSHMVGSSNRVDIARLRRMEIALTERDETIGRQQLRLQQTAGDRAQLMRRIDALEADAARLQSAQVPARPAEPTSAIAARLEAERMRSAALQQKLDAAEARLAAAQDRIEALEAREQALQGEVAAIERELSHSGAGSSADVAGAAGLAVLYVGGRPGLVDQLRGFATRHDVQLLHHDGGIDDNLGLLPGLVSRADVAYFPVDCISHRAMNQIKKLCTDAGKAFKPLRTASFASFLAAMAADANGRPAWQDGLAMPRF